jgi:hypothetical protein
MLDRTNASRLATLVKEYQDVCSQKQLERPWPGFIPVCIEFQVYVSDLQTTSS